MTHEALKANLSPETGPGSDSTSEPRKGGSVDVGVAGVAVTATPGTDPQLSRQLADLAKRSSAWVPGVRLHPDDIEQLPRPEPKPIWAGGGIGHLLGTPVFADPTIPRGTYKVATHEWITARAAERS